MILRGKHYRRPIVVMGVVDHLGHTPIASPTLAFYLEIFLLPNGCFDAYEVKVNKGIFKYKEKVKLISQFQRFFLFFNGLLEFASFP